MKAVLAFWTSVWVRIIVSLPMGRDLQIRVAFESSRLGEERIRRAYELVVPARRRRTCAPTCEPVEVEADTQAQQSRSMEEG